MSGDGYRRFSVPEELIKEVEDYIRANPSQGYTSVAEFVKDSIRKNLCVQCLTKDDLDTIRLLRKNFKKIKGI